MGKLGCGCGAGVGTSMVVTIILAWQKYNHLSNIKKNMFNKFSDILFLL
jgi:galactitol-specific phosphotransferase system IIB component